MQQGRQVRLATGGPGNTWGHLFRDDGERRLTHTGRLLPPSHLLPPKLYHPIVFDELKSRFLTVTLTCSNSCTASMRWFEKRLNAISPL